MRTQQECIEAAARCFAVGYELLETLPVEEAARIAWTPTGPSIPELERRIREYRGLPLDDTSSPASGVGEGSTSAATGLGAPRPLVVAEHHKKSA